MVETTDNAELIARLQNAVRKLAAWVGSDITDLIEAGLLKEGDMR